MVFHQVIDKADKNCKIRIVLLMFYWEARLDGAKRRLEMINKPEAEGCDGAGVTDDDIIDEPEAKDVPAPPKPVESQISVQAGITPPKPALLKPPPKLLVSGSFDADIDPLDGVPG